MVWSFFPVQAEIFDNQIQVVHPFLRDPPPTHKYATEAC